MSSCFFRLYKDKSLSKNGWIKRRLFSMVGCSHLSLLIDSSRLVMRKSRSDGTFVLAWIMFTVCIPSNSEALSAIRLLTKDLFGER